jgi:hypothetical protein
MVQIRSIVATDRPTVEPPTTATRPAPIHREIIPILLPEATITIIQVGVTIPLDLIRMVDDPPVTVLVQEAIVAEAEAVQEADNPLILQR